MYDSPKSLSLSWFSLLWCQRCPEVKSRVFMVNPDVLLVNQFHSIPLLTAPVATLKSQCWMMVTWKSQGYSKSQGEWRHVIDQGDTHNFDWWRVDVKNSGLSIKTGDVTSSHIIIHRNIILKGNIIGIFTSNMMGTIPSQYQTLPCDSIPC